MIFTFSEINIIPRGKHYFLVAAPGPQEELDRIRDSSSIAANNFLISSSEYGTAGSSSIVGISSRGRRAVMPFFLSRNDAIMRCPDIVLPA